MLTHRIARLVAEAIADRDGRFQHNVVRARELHFIGDSIAQGD
jgi:hypothetical protein